MIRVQIPDMPSTEELLPYLRRIDEARAYVNRGPLVQELEARLEKMCSVPCVTVSSGTAALELALRSLRGAGKGVLLPALTFSATGLAVLSARAEPVLCDVSAENWQLQAATVKELIENRKAEIDDHLDQGHSWGPAEISAVIPVATFGLPIELTQWEGLSIPVIIDAAGAFPSQQVSKTPNVATCFSLHATKFVGAGEGGFVASANDELIDRIIDLSTFGKFGTNAKLSEYHAAVALASLDRMGGKLQRTAEVYNWYKEHGIADWKHKLSSTMLVVELPRYDATLSYMTQYGVECRQWYRPWLDERPEFAGGGKLPVTESLRQRLLGLPLHNFLTERDVAHVMETLRKVMT